MNRREFFATGAMTGAGLAMFPRDLFARSTKTINKNRYPNQLKFKKDGDWKEFELYIDVHIHEPAPGFRYHTLAFNNMIPGPEIRVNVGDKVRVRFKNKTGLNHTIHWHGLHTPWRMDGVPFVTQLPVMPDNEFVYEFEAKPAGTHFYHCHWSTVMHIQSGMFGSFIIEDPDDPIKKKYNYDREYTLVYSSHDVNFIREELNGMLTRMKERTYLNRNGRFDKERFGVFDTVDELMTSMKENGYEPPYLNTRKSPELPEENWFTVNGKSYPTTPIMYIREGEKIRVRLINAGELIHSLHLHGQDFFEVANDGIPLKNHIEMNTIPIYPGKTHDIVIDGYNRGIWTFHDHNTLRVTNNGRYPGGNLMTLVYEDLPEEERMIVPYSGNQMFNGMDNNNMMTWGGPKLPKITLDQ